MGPYWGAKDVALVSCVASLNLRQDFGEFVLELF